MTERGFLFLRNLHSSTLPNPQDYSKIYYDPQILYPESVNFELPKSLREERVKEAIKCLQRYYKRKIEPLGGTPPNKMVVKIPLQEKYTPPEIPGTTWQITSSREVVKKKCNTFKSYYQQALKTCWEGPLPITELEKTVERNLVRYWKTSLAGYNKRRLCLTDHCESRISSWTALGVLPPQRLYHLIQDNFEQGSKDWEEYRRQTYWILYCKYKYYDPQWSGNPKLWPLPKLSTEQQEKLKLWAWGTLPEGQKKWIKGKWGGTIVETYLNQKMKEFSTNTLPNRFRLFSSYYLCKNLKVPWRYGELVFRSILEDYHPAINYYNWYAQCVKNRFLKFYDLNAQLRKKI